MCFPGLHNTHNPYRSQTGPLQAPAPVKSPPPETVAVTESVVSQPKPRLSSLLRKADEIGEAAQQAVMTGQIRPDFIRGVPLEASTEEGLNGVSEPGVGSAASSPDSLPTDTGTDAGEIEIEIDTAPETDADPLENEDSPAETAAQTLAADSAGQEDQNGQQADELAEDPPAPPAPPAEQATELDAEAPPETPAPAAVRLQGRAAEIHAALQLGLRANPPLNHPDQKYVDFGRALQLQGVTEADLAAFLAADPAALLDEKQHAQLPESIQQAYRNIQQKGSWPALNAVTGLIDLQKARLGQSAPEQKLDAELNALKGNLAVRRSRSGIGAGNARLAQAAQLEAEARQASQPAQQAALLKKAQAARDQGLKRLESEKADQLRFVRLAERQGRPPRKYFSDGVSEAAIGLGRGYLAQARSERAQQPGRGPAGPDGLPALPAAAQRAQENLDLAIAVDGDLRSAPQQGPHSPEVIQKNIALGEVLADVGQFRRETYPAAGPQSPALIQARSAETVRLAALTQNRIDWVAQATPEQFAGDREATLVALGLEQEGYQKEVMDDHLALEAISRTYESHSRDLRQGLETLQESAGQLAHQIDKLKANPIFMSGLAGQDSLAELMGQKAEIEAQLPLIAEALEEARAEQGQLAEQGRALRAAYRDTQAALRDDPRLAYLAEGPGLNSGEIPERLLHQRDQNMARVAGRSTGILNAPGSSLAQKQQALDALGQVARFEADTATLPARALDAGYQNVEGASVQLKSPAARREAAVQTADSVLNHYRALTAAHGFQAEAADHTVHTTTAVSRAVALHAPEPALRLLKESAEIAQGDPTGESKPALQKRVYAAATDNQRALFERQNLPHLCRLSEATGLRADAQPIIAFRDFRRELQAEVSDPALQRQIAADFATETAAPGKLADMLRAKASQMRQGAREIASFADKWQPVYAERADDQVSDLGGELLQALAFGAHSSIDVGKLEAQFVDQQLRDIYVEASDHYLGARGLEQLADTLENATPEAYYQLVSELRLREEDDNIENFVAVHLMDDAQRNAHFDKPMAERNGLVKGWTRNTFDGMNHALDVLSPSRTSEDPEETRVVAKGLGVQTEDVAEMSWYDGTAFKVLDFNRDEQVGLPKILALSESDLAAAEVDQSQQPVVTSKAIAEMKAEAEDYQAYHRSSQSAVNWNEAAYALATLLPVGKLAHGASNLLVSRLSWAEKALDKGYQLVDKLTQQLGKLNNSAVGIRANASLKTLEGFSKEMITNPAAHRLAMNVGKEVALEQLISLGPDELSDALDWMQAAGRTEANWKEALVGVTQVAIEHWDELPPEVRSVLSPMLGGATKQWTATKPKANPAE